MARLFGTTTTSVTQPATGGRLFGAKPVSEGLQTPAGLQQLAETKGLGEEAQSILSGKGEDPERIYSGGIISDVFDTLNSLQYGVVGLLKGKSFMEGLRTRESFTKEDALGDKGIPGFIGGLIADIAVDPLTYVPILGIGKAGLKLIKGGAQVIGKVATKAPGVSQAGNVLGRAFIYRFGQDPIYKEIAERSTKNIAVGVENMMDIVRPLTKLDASVQRAIAEARKTGELIPKGIKAPKIAQISPKIAPELEPLAQEARKYKSAEEFKNFVNTKSEPIYRGTQGIGELEAIKRGEVITGNWNFSFDTAKRYSETLLEDRVTKGISVKGRGTFVIQGARFPDGFTIPVKVIDSKTGKTLKGFEPKDLLTDFYNQAVGGVSKLPETIKGLTPEILAKAKPAFDELDRLGKEAVESGLLKKEVYEQNVGQYIARLYRKHEVPEGVVGKVKGFFEAKPLRVNLERFKKRTDIPEDVREAMGEILEAGYPTAKSLVQLTQAVERAKFFKTVAGNWAKDIIEEGFAKLPDVKTLGELAGKAVPKPIFDDIQEIIRIKSPAEKVLGKVVAGFKFGKVILNPATHARNIMSNFILNNFEGLSPARLDIYAKAARELATKGDLYKEAKSVGLGVDTFASAELKQMLRGPEFGKLSNTIRNWGNKIADLYQKEEEFAKMAQYIFQRGKGLNPEEALKISERATFNYAQVTPFIRRVRESIFGYPFITFTYKVTPQVAKTLVTKPTKISNIGKIKQAIENQSDLRELSAERATEPEWVRDGFYVKLPMKDKFGRSAYLDLTYILPFGDLVSGQLLERDVKRETGLPESPAESTIKKLPLFNLLREFGRNQDFFGNKIWRESDSIDGQLGDVMRHISKTYLPPLLGDQLPGGYRTTGEKRPTLLQRIVTKPEQLETGGAQQRTLAEEMLRQAGIKISPVDLELQRTFSEREKTRALETLLKERGELAEFKRTFVPKEKRPVRGRLFQSQ